MKKRIASAVAAVLATLPLCASAARVIEKDGVPVGWTEHEVIFDIDPNLPSNISFTNALAQVQAAALLWNGQTSCGAPKIRVSTVPANPGASGDNRNTIQWVLSDWAQIGENPSASGYTDVLIETLDGSSRIRETDILLNAESFTWKVGTPQPPAVMGILTTVAHEMGHALGLDHPCEYSPVAGVPDCAAWTDQTALMYPVLVVLEPALTSDDLVGLCASYPADPCASDPYGCTSATGTSVVAPECADSADCEGGRECVLGTCEPIPHPVGDKCTSEQDCASFFCYEGACRERCTIDETCLSGDLCNPETMVCGTGTLRFNKTCSAPEECISGLCYVDSGPRNYCTRFCDAGNSCPSGWECISEDSQQSFCALPVADKGGCEMVHNPRTNQLGLIGLLGGIVMMGLRRLMRTRAVK